MNLDLHLTAYIKINLNLIIGLNETTETITFPEKYRGENHSNLGFGKDFFAKYNTKSINYERQQKPISWTS